MNYYNKLIEERNKLEPPVLEKGGEYICTTYSKQTEGIITKEMVDQNDYDNAYTGQPSNYKILGKELTLQDVLRMLGMNYSISGDGTFYLNFEGKEFAGEVIGEYEEIKGIKLDISKPLKDQEEVLKQIYELIN